MEVNKARMWEGEGALQHGFTGGNRAEEFRISRSEMQGLKWQVEENECYPISNGTGEEL